MSITYHFAYSEAFLKYLKICSHLLKKFLMETSPFVQCTKQIHENCDNIVLRKMCRTAELFGPPFCISILEF